MASLHDVARLAGVSKSTVSRVINNEYGVKEATKLKVMKAVDEVGYVVNQVAKDLKSQKTNLVGVIVPRVSSNATSQGVDGLSRIFEKAGKHVLLASTQQSDSKEIEFIRLFNQKRVEGIVLYATHIDTQLVEAISQSRAPIVLIGQDGSLFNIPSIVHDDLRVGYEAGKRLLNAGCENIGFIGVADSDLAVDKQRSDGLKQALTMHSEQELLFHCHGEFSIESGYANMRRLIKECPQVDGVFCATDRIAIGAIKALQEENIVVGEQVKILGVGNDELGFVVSPSLSTFSYPFDKAGESGANVLLELIEGKPQVMSKVVLTFQNIQRETC
ncbi:LacI family transcriptional regulator [Vibrio coralliilyticus]|uniref:Sucrose operon repressor ScrR n=1 Tax=Vibrio coralliilyticus TaxID=190893 RepID=A0AAN0VXA2_9VIBR|nr:LacI family DNA-binding transcriptional regulator [Vibrio coralliilyticus]AIU66485.1 sucrose operon repressor ScrR [Vibrio coralliilyticus]AIW19205.1 sucrose operon repressor ScrR [Vibrio coralliilyticus]NOH39684.1 LacI family transcriptional regulator [Vibrio coralliilyticus]